METANSRIYPPHHLCTLFGTNVVGFELLELSGKVTMVAERIFLRFGQPFMFYSTDVYILTILQHPLIGPSYFERTFD
jgi:hypothetical protein